MILSPRYDGPPIVAIDGPPSAPLLPCTRQRRRMETLLAELTDDEWSRPSRCAGWSVRDVVTHLTGVNVYWQISVQRGAAGRPTRALANFDPVATPAQLVAAAEVVAPSVLLAQFVASNDGFLGAIAALTDEQWTMAGESPVGHVPMQLVVHHALWDAWVHERDIALPLGRPVTDEPDEVTACLRYVAALGPALALTFGGAAPGQLSVEATQPDCALGLTLTDTVSVADDAAVEAPCLRGTAADLTEALSMRSDLPPGTPEEWVRMRAGLATAFDAVG